MLTPKELEIINVGVEKGKTKAEIAAALVKYNSTLPPKPIVQKSNIPGAPDIVGEQPGFIESTVDRAKDTWGDIKETGTAIKNTFTRSVDRQREILDAGGSGEQGALSTGYQTTMNFLGTLGGLVGDVIMGAGKVAFTPEAEERIKARTQEIAQPIYESPLVQEWISRYKALEKESPEMARNIVATAQGGEFLLNFLGLKAVEQTAATVARGAEKAFIPVVGKLDDTAKNAAILANQIKNETPIIATQVGEAVVGKPGALETLLTSAKNRLSRIPSRTKTNVAALQAEEDIIQSLPSQTAKTAARDGVNPSDIKTLYTLPKDQAPAYQKLVDTTKKYAAGDKTVDPVEIVGEPMVARIKELEAAKKEIGAKLGEAAEDLGRVTREELQPVVFNKLKSVKGLEGLKLTPAGELDFSSTVLATKLTLADRKAIRAIYQSAISNGTGKSKHLLRQELFEVLGGQKGIAAMTETQDKAYQAVRQGLADVLDTKNATYKALNAEYAKVANPLKDLDSTMRFSKLDDGLKMGANEDLYNMAAGLLARRITSLAKSNPEIMALLRSMDSATAKAGKTAVSVEAMQNLYNILNNYYDISPKTGFQGQIKGALENTGSFTGEALKGLKGLTGETPAVRQKALESVLDELFGSTPKP